MKGEVFVKATENDQEQLLPTKKKKKKLVKKLKSYAPLILLMTPALVYFIMFHYAPMAGVVLAFKNFRYDLGIFGSPWVGLDNFKFFFTSNDAWRILRNTVGYSFLFIIVNNVAALTLALLLNEIKSKTMLKIHQTAMLLPNFLSWVLVGFITFIFLNPTSGVMNQFLELIGQDSVNWYQTPQHWPVILTTVNLWKGLGMSTIMYFASLLGVDPQLYEAARIDGASRFKQAIHISLPALMPVFTILMILAIGDTFRGDFGLFYQIPRNVGLLYPTTDIIDTYIFRGLRTGDLSITAAVGLFQSAVGLVLILIVNKIVRKISPDNALF